MVRIESLLSARLFLAPQLVGPHLYFISNLSGRNSLFVMDVGGSVPTPLLPPHIALQNPHLMEGRAFVVFPRLNQILVMIDQDGDEDYQPMLIPIDGGYPTPLADETFAGHSVMCYHEDLAHNIVYLLAESRTEPVMRSYRADLAHGGLLLLNESQYGGNPAAHSADHQRFVLVEGYGAGDNVLFHLRAGQTTPPQPFFGTPIQRRTPETEVQLASFTEMFMVRQDTGLLFNAILFDDAYGLGYLPLDGSEAARPVPISGLQHQGGGELASLTHLAGSRYALEYNIDGASWLYEAELDEEALTMAVRHVLVGRPPLHQGVLESFRYDPDEDRFALSFSTAVSPTQLHTIAGPQRDQRRQHTQESLLGISTPHLSPGEDYSFTSFDGLRISARLYLPSPHLDFTGPRPLIYYIHGGPQSQERPDFAWFSMPLIQFLTLQGFAVFVPNVRGSTGYGFAYMKHVVKDWGGQDRLDHVHAMTAVLPQDERLDTGRTGVVGRSYGGYMTLTLAGRHPELWSAAVDMFGPYDLLTFADRVPETWKPFVAMLVGDPETERDFMIERSPRTYIDQVACPLLVVQGHNDPRVREVESRELVEHLRAQGKQVAYLMLPDEGHDILKFDNRVRVYNTITAFFRTHLGS